MRPLFEAQDMKLRLMCHVHYEPQLLLSLSLLRAPSWGLGYGQRAPNWSTRFIIKLVIDQIWGRICSLRLFGGRMENTLWKQFSQKFRGLNFYAIVPAGIAIAIAFFVPFMLFWSKVFRATGQMLSYHDSNVYSTNANSNFAPDRHFINQSRLLQLKVLFHTKSLIFFQHCLNFLTDLIWPPLQFHSLGLPSLSFPLMTVLLPCMFGLLQNILLYLKTKEYSSMAYLRINLPTAVAHCPQAPFIVAEVSFTCSKFDRMSLELVWGIESHVASFRVHGITFLRVGCSCNNEQSEKDEFQHPCTWVSSFTSWNLKGNWKWCPWTSLLLGNASLSKLIVKSRGFCDSNNLFPS